MFSLQLKIEKMSSCCAELFQVINNRVGSVVTMRTLSCISHLAYIILVCSFFFIESIFCIYCMLSFCFIWENRNSIQIRFFAVIDIHLYLKLVLISLENSFEEEKLTIVRLQEKAETVLYRLNMSITVSGK